MHSTNNPFTAVPEMQISHLGESALLDHIQEWLGTVTPPTPLGMGDDCALLKFDAKQKTPPHWETLPPGNVENNSVCKIATILFTDLMKFREPLLFQKVLGPGVSRLEP